MFLEVITRTCKRPALLAVNQASLQVQTCDDWVQTLLVDNVGRGMAYAQGQLADFAPSGDYLWLLDDDDACIRPELVEELKAIAAAHKPGVIMMRMDHGPLGVKPEDEYWRQPPVMGHLGCSAYVVRRDVWLEHAHAWRSGQYWSDYLFIADVWKVAPAVHWHDVIASRVQRISNGAGE